jgi:hypothetical protein
MKRTVAGLAFATMFAAGVAWAGTIVGTPRADVLNGTHRSDRIYGKGGNDRLFGRGGKDLLVGGPGADLLACGSGADVAWVDEKDTVRRDCEFVKGLPKPPQPVPPPASGGLYIALGDSISTSIGASSAAKSWVNLYSGYLASRGVTSLYNLAQPGHTTTDLRAFRAPRAVSIINDANDTLRVTITIGINDRCVSEPQCRVADNLRAVLTMLNDALARDPGDETIQIMEYFNPAIGTPTEAETRSRLLGSDLRVDCSGPAARSASTTSSIALPSSGTPCRSTSSLLSMPAARASSRRITLTRAMPAISRSHGHSAQS